MKSEYIVTINLTGDYAIIKLKGGWEEPTKKMKEVIRGMINNGMKKVIISLGEFNGMRSSSLSFLCFIMICCKKSEGEVVLCESSEKWNSYLKLMNLDKYFLNFSSQEEAIRYLQRQEPIDG